MNNLDLSVFPCISRRHTQLAREHNGLRMLTEDQIWDTAKSVCDRLPSSKVASGFIQAHWIAQRVIEFQGSNSFLTGSKIHFGVRRDYTETATGLKHSDELLPPLLLNHIVSNL